MSPRSASGTCRSLTTTRLSPMQQKSSAKPMAVSIKTCLFDIGRSFPMTELSASMGFVSMTTSFEMVRFPTSSSQPRLPQTKPAAIAKNSTSIFSISAGTFICTSFHAAAAPVPSQTRQKSPLRISRSNAGRGCSRWPRRACGCRPRSWSGQNNRSHICGNSLCRRSPQTRRTRP